LILTLDSTSVTSMNPFIASFNTTVNKFSKLVTIKTQTPLVSDFALNCKIFHQGKFYYSKATQLSSNSLLCNVEATSLTLNTELVFISLSLNDTLGELLLSPQNLTLVCLKEPISISGVPKTILSNNFLKNVTLDFDDVRLTNIVSFTNYTVIMTPEFHTPRNLICYFDSKNPKCLIPSLVVDYVPVRLNVILKVFSLQNNGESSVNVDYFYYKENVTISQDYPFLIDIESYLVNPVTMVFNVSKLLNPLYSFYCQCKRNHI
jgi:hypothetical protein